MKRYFNQAIQTTTRIPAISAAIVIVFVITSIIVSSHSFLAFFSLEGLVIVGGGVIAVAFMSFDNDDVRKALDAIARMFKAPKTARENLHADITAIIFCARLLKDKGMRNLESVIQKSGISDPFVKYGFNMVVSEYAPEEVRAMLETAADACYERDHVPVDVLHAMASHGPAFGMVGTLVGMVALLCSLNGDLANIGPSLAVAFLSTLYGVLSARMVYIPAASKLRQEITNRRFRNYLITEGLVMLVANKNPMYIQDRLNSFLRPEFHDYLNVINVKQGAEQNAQARPMARAA
jgi:chemotaxis protein MotA